MVVDDIVKNTGRKRNAILNKEFKYISELIVISLEKLSWLISLFQNKNYEIFNYLI